MAKEVFIFETINFEEHDTITDYEIYETKEKALKAYKKKIEYLQKEINHPNLIIKDEGTWCDIYLKNSAESFELSVFPRPLL